MACRGHPVLKQNAFTLRALPLTAPRVAIAPARPQQRQPARIESDWRAWANAAQWWRRCRPSSWLPCSSPAAISARPTADAPHRAARRALRPRDPRPAVAQRRLRLRAGVEHEQPCKDARLVPSPGDGSRQSEDSLSSSEERVGVRNLNGFNCLEEERQTSPKTPTEARRTAPLHDLEQTPLLVEFRHTRIADHLDRANLRASPPGISCSVGSILGRLFDCITPVQARIAMTSVASAAFTPSAVAGCNTPASSSSTSPRCPSAQMLRVNLGVRSSPTSRPPSPRSPRPIHARIARLDETRVGTPTSGRLNRDLLGAPARQSDRRPTASTGISAEHADVTTQGLHLQPTADAGCHGAR